MFEDVWKKVLKPGKAQHSGAGEESSGAPSSEADSSIVRPSSQETGSAKPSGANIPDAEFSGEERIYTQSSDSSPSILDQSSQETASEQPGAAESSESTSSNDELVYKWFSDAFSDVANPRSQKTAGEQPGAAESSESIFSSQEPNSTYGPYTYRDTNSDTEFLRSTLRMDMRTVPYPVAIVTASGQQPYAQYKDCTYAATVSSCNTVCLDPEPYVSFNLAAKSITHATIAATRHFAVTFLEDTRAAGKLASRFSKGNTSSAFSKNGRSMGHEPIEFGDWASKTIPRPDAQGLERLPPALQVSGATAFSILCEHTQSIPVGDHVLIIGRVLRIARHGGYMHDERYRIGDSPTTRVHTCLTYAQGAYSTEDDGTRFGDLTRPSDPYVLADFSSLSNEDRLKIEFRYKKRIELIQAARNRHKSSEKYSRTTPIREDLRNRMERYFQQQLDALKSSSPGLGAERTGTRSTMRPAQRERVSLTERLAISLLEQEEKLAAAPRSTINESHAAMDSMTVLKSREMLREVQENFSSLSNSGKLRMSLFLRWDRERAAGKRPSEEPPELEGVFLKSPSSRGRLAQWFCAWKRQRATEERELAAPLETNIDDCNTAVDSLTVLKSGEELPEVQGTSSSPRPDPESETEGEKHKHQPFSAPGSELEGKRVASATGGLKVRRVSGNPQNPVRGHRR